MEKYKSYWIPKHDKPKNPTAYDYCRKALCDGLCPLQCEECLFYTLLGERPEFREWIKEKEAR
jgi:hypothetical protein